MLRNRMEVLDRRDKLVNRFRLALDGRNGIKAPKSMQYKVAVAHTRHLNAIINEKVSRYRPTPEVKIVPVGTDGKITDRSKEKAEKISKWANAMFYQLERQGADAVWRNLVWDLHVADAACEKWLAAPNAFWPKLVPYKKRFVNAENNETYDEPEEQDDLMRQFRDKKEYEKAKEEYKRTCGIPLTRMHVPIERFYPVFDGPMLVEGFEIREVTLRSLMNNPLFKGSVLMSYPKGSDGGLSQMVVVMEYSNARTHAYYALAPSGNGRNAWPQIQTTKSLFLGTPVLLHSYEHGLGRPVFNYMVGRGGGWIHGESRQEGVMEALLDLNEQLDYLHSQISTFIRNTLWPTRVAKYDPELRGADDGLPKAPTIEEGSTIPMWLNESIENITANIPEFNLATWQYDQIIDRMNFLAGSANLFGQRQPGVNTGYHAQINLNQAKNLDSQIENALVRGAVNGIELAFLHVKALGEKMYAFAPERGKLDNSSHGDWIAIDPKDLDPLPQISVKVIDPQPNDLLIASQTAMALTQIRPGHNTPLLPDSIVIRDVLGFPDAEDIERQVRAQDMRTKMFATPAVATDMATRLGFELARRQSAIVSPDDAANASPAFMGAINEVNTSGEAEQMGGVNPQNLSNQIEGQQRQTGAGGVLKGRGGGIAPGAPQPLQTQGRAQQLLRNA